MVEIEATAFHLERLVPKFATLIKQKCRKLANFEQILARIRGRDLDFNQSSFKIYPRPNVSFHNKKPDLGLNAASGQPQIRAKE